MGSKIKWVFILVLFVFSTPAMATISFTNGSWSTTFNCSSWTQGGSFPSCNGLTADGGWKTASGSGDQITAAANNPAGGGGLGFRHWRGNGDNNCGGGVAIAFPSAQKELWIRWYARYQSGFSWSTLLYAKELYIHASSWAVIPEFTYNGYNVTTETGGNNNGSTPYYEIYNANYGWNNVNGGSVGDGNFHCYEVHIKMDTSANSNFSGVGQLWIDGVLKASNPAVNFSGGSSADMNGWTTIEVGSNEQNPNNPSDYYEDFDDITIYNVTPPNKDTSGNAFIGPIGWGGGGGGGTNPTVTAFSIPSTSTNLTVPINTFTANNASTYCASSGSNSNGCSWLVSPPTSVTFTAAGTQTAYGWAKDSTGTISAPASASVAITTPINGACGSANGQSFASLTSGSSNLCSTGPVASFTGSGPWTWGCNGSGGGTSTSSSACSASLTSSPSATLLFSENFEDENFAARGWYDNTNHGTIASGGQSGNCLQWAWTSGQTTPTNGGSMRYNNFTPTDTLYLSYYVKFQTGWEGSQQTYHPHMMYILSDLDNAASAYSPLAHNYLDTYVEFLSDIGSPYTIRPQIALQDEKRTNTSNGTPPNNLTAITENRSVNYCNTPVSSGATGACYADTTYYSANVWKAASASVSTNAWHHIEVYFKMNSISNGIGQHDGIMQEWVDGTQVIDHSDVLYRTNQDATKKWAQFVLAPYIGSGSPITQNMWIDSLQVWNGNPNSGSTSMTPVSGFAVKSASPTN